MQLRIDAALTWDRDRVLTEKVSGAYPPRCIPEGHDVDDNVARMIADRIFVWVISDRHEAMTMGKTMRGWVHERLALEEDAE